MVPSNWVLLIEPYRNMVNAYRMILEANNFGVEVATNLHEAYRQFFTRNYSITIMEYFPPSEDTCQIIRWMKQQMTGIYIIMVTDTNIDRVVYEKLFAEGLDDFFLKPYSLEKILVHIQKGLKQKELILEKQELERQNIFDFSCLRMQKYIFNQIYFRRCLRQELKKAKRHGRPLSLMLIKLPPEERKKELFDDFCIEMAGSLRTFLREGDIVARENGSFEILLPETDQAGSKALLQRLSNLIQKHPPFESDNALKLFLQALSFQVFTYPEMADVPDSLGMVLKEINQETTYH